MLELDKIYNMDCLEGMKQIEDNSIDMILCDLPYGTTSCSWDSIIPLDKLWEQYKRIIKSYKAIILTATQPFATKLILSNEKCFKYEWIWIKSTVTDYLNARNKPLRQHENILVFSDGTTANKSNKKMCYNPQMKKGKPYKKIQRTDPRRGYCNAGNRTPFIGVTCINKGERFPGTCIEIPFGNHKVIHPTQKPLELFEYFIKTYSNEGDVVLDNCMGSGTTAVACKRLNRRFIGFEIDKRYYDISIQRLLNVPVRLEKWIDS